MEILTQSWSLILINFIEKAMKPTFYNLIWKNQVWIRSDPSQVLQLYYIFNKGVSLLEVTLLQANQI